MLTFSVPSAPRSLTLELLSDSPPIVEVTWHNPADTAGELDGFKLYYGHQGESAVTERRFTGDVHRHTSHFLGA